MADPQAKQKNRTLARLQFVLLVVAGVMMVLAVLGFVWQQSISERNERWEEVAEQIVVDLRELPLMGGRSTSRVSDPDFAHMANQGASLRNNVTGLLSGSSESNISRLPSSLQDELQNLIVPLDQVSKTLDGILENNYQFRETLNAIGNLDGHIETMLANVLPSNQAVLLERIRSASSRLLTSGESTQQGIAEIKRYEQAFSRQFTPGDNRELAESYEAVKDSIEGIASLSAGVDVLLKATEQLQLETAKLTLQPANELQQAILQYTARFRFLPYLVAGSGALALLSLVGFIALFVLDLSRRAKESAAAESRQQQAILGLLDGITNLADGDLTVDVNVTEDFTGAIADSINYTVSNMRSLVGTINNSSQRLSEAAENTQDIARNMNEASERQAKEITAVSNTITASSQSLQQVASRAEQLAQQAQSSVATAHDGAATVGRAIQGMAALREQIQDTAKRIKRLGESSQEIGNITELINDIAEQTNTLALNASIQAAMAGEAGRGFAVVADEVQRLAERAGGATRQIENLVKTIQADTNEAIISMERSTQNVVTGARSAEEAGQALTKIESSSQELSQLITEIASSARNQSVSATKIAGTMQVIRDIAIQTSGSAGQTAQAVGELGALSATLRESVSGFKLPE